MKFLSARGGSITALGMVTMAALALAGCNRRPSSPPPASAPAAAPAAATNPAAAPAAPSEPRLYGAPLAAASKTTTIAELLANPEPLRNQTITVEGEVRKACTRKGCWMELAASTKDGTPGCRVTFKDYGFFVPTDSAGAHARVQGTIEIDTLSAAAVRHYEEEGAKFPSKRADGTAPEVRLVATGVELQRGPAGPATN